MHKAGTEKTSCKAFAALEPGGKIVPHTITRRACSPHDIMIDIHFAGICHSDIHQARNEWSNDGVFPMVPGHEIGGIVTAVGTNVTKFHVGDQVGVGCMVDSCRKCKYCHSGEEQFCTPIGAVFTYNSTFKVKLCIHSNTRCHVAHVCSSIVSSLP
jgi:alcohol dehydrogenase (NADP+)